MKCAWSSLFEGTLVGSNCRQSCTISEWTPKLTRSFADGLLIGYMSRSIMPYSVGQPNSTIFVNFLKMPEIDAEAFRDDVIKLHPQKLATPQFLVPGTQN